MLKVTSIVIALFLLMGIIMSFASKRKTERQAYRLVKKLNGMEIRFYPRALMATVTEKPGSYMEHSNSMFRSLASYIFGGNAKNEKIAMTAPVHVERDSLNTRMSFVMPSNLSMEQLPQPSNGNIALHYSEEAYYAVMDFGGYANESKIQKTEEKLRKALQESGIPYSGAFKYLGYNAPWDFINRENEVLVKINYTEQ